MSERPAPKRPRLALLGSRGIPACYGGYETLMEELAPRLVQRGFDVTVYCRSHYTPRRLREYRGVRLVVLPTVRTKHLDTPVHTFLSCAHAALFGRYDAALVVNAANAMFVPLLRLRRIPSALHVDGMERRRAKWGALGRSVYRVSEWLACHVADRLVTDAEVIRRLYLDRHATDSVMIPYGSELARPEGRATLDRLRLSPRGYFLYVSRFEPENNPHRVVEAYRAADVALPLVMLGDAPYATDFIRGFRRDEPGVLYPGAIYGEGYRELQANAAAYVHATEVGGTHPALVEAMGFGNCVLVHDTPENREVAGDAALYFDAHDPSSLARLLVRASAEPELVAELRARAAARARERYSWDRVSADYAALAEELVARRERDRRS